MLPVIADDFNMSKLPNIAKFQKNEKTLWESWEDLT